MLVLLSLLFVQIFVLDCSLLLSLVKVILASTTPLFPLFPPQVVNEIPPPDFSVDLTALVRCLEPARHLRVTRVVREPAPNPASCRLVLQVWSDGCELWVWSDGWE